MPTPASPDAIASPRSCAPFCGGAGRPRARRPPPAPAPPSGQGGCGRPLDRVAGWVGGGIAAAFFASLERCSCVNVRTQDDDDLDDEQRVSEAPLMSHDGNGNGAGGRRRRGGRRNDKAGTIRSGGGIGCYGDFNR